MLDRSPWHFYSHWEEEALNETNITVKRESPKKRKYLLNKMFSTGREWKESDYKFFSLVQGEGKEKIALDSKEVEKFKERAMGNKKSFEKFKESFAQGLKRIEVADKTIYLLEKIRRSLPKYDRVPEDKKEDLMKNCKKAKENVKEGNFHETARVINALDGYLGKSKNGSERESLCFIATASLGSPLHPELRYLCEFRNEILVKSSFGKSLVHIYYRISPVFAKIVSKSSNLRKGTRAFIVEPAIRFVQKFR